MTLVGPFQLRTWCDSMSSMSRGPALQGSVGGVQWCCHNLLLQAVTAMGKALLEFVWALRFHTDS